MSDEELVLQEPLEPAPAPADPATADADAVLEWVNEGWRERAEVALATERAKPPAEQDLLLIADLVAALEGQLEEPEPPKGTRMARRVVRLNSTRLRERQMYEAELRSRSTRFTEQTETKEQQ